MRVGERAGGAEGNRTPDLSSAIAALYQLSYGPRFPGAGRGDSTSPFGKQHT